MTAWSVRRKAREIPAFTLPKTHTSVILPKSLVRLASRGTWPHENVWRETIQPIRGTRRQPEYERSQNATCCRRLSFRQWSRSDWVSAVPRWSRPAARWPRAVLRPRVIHVLRRNARTIPARQKTRATLAQPKRHATHVQPRHVTPAQPRAPVILAAVRSSRRVPATHALPRKRATPALLQPAIRATRAVRSLR